jgi:hypothetical protein
MDLMQSLLTLQERRALAQAEANLKNARCREVQMERGLWRGILLPGLLKLSLFTAGCWFFSYFAVMRIRNENMQKSADSLNYFDANSAYVNGNLDLAGMILEKILLQHPDAPMPNILKAKLSVALGNNEAAIPYLKKARKFSLDSDEINRWLQKLESPH